jgi:hypothetical protein
LKRCEKEYTIKFLRSCVPGERTQDEQNYCRLRGGGGGEVEEDNGTRRQFSNCRKNKVKMLGGEVEEDNGTRRQFSNCRKNKVKMLFEFGPHIQPYMLPTKGTNCTEVSNNYTKY